MREFELPGVAGRLRYHDLPGDGPAVVFVHGLGCASSSDFPRAAADPALAGRRKLLVDLPGFGYSDAPAGFGHAVEDHAGAVVALVEALALASFDLVGHSMGGAVAIEAASRRPRAVRRLVLCEPNLDAGGGAFSSPIARQDESDYIARGHAATVRGAIASGSTMWAASARVASPLAVHRGATSLVRGGSPSWREQLRALAMPRTVIFGEASLPDPDTEALPRMGVAVRIVTGAGHAMMIENPAGFAEAVRAALA